MEKQIIEKLKLSFDDIVHSTEDGLEYWYARELQMVLGYSEWRNFVAVISRAKITCETSGFKVSDHFVDVNKMIDLPKGTTRQIEDIVLTRCACYLIAQKCLDIHNGA